MAGTSPAMTGNDSDQRLAVSGRLGRRIGRHPRGKTVEPGDQPRVLAAPAAAEPEVAVTERAGERDLTDIRERLSGLERGRRRLEHRKRARNFAGLQIEPFRLVHLGFTKAALVDGEDRRIENAVAQRLQAQRGHTLRPASRHDLAAAGALIEIIEDYARVVNRAAV